MAKTQYLTAPIKTTSMPPGVPYIIGNEAAERFSYYGMNSILVIFMTQYLLNRQGQPDAMSESMANGWYHTFVSAVYFLPIFGAILADAFVGKFRVVFYLSIVYCLGHLALALDHTRFGLAVGLGLIALGAGGIKPCVSSNVGDQFGASNQHLLPRAFSWFYFSINFGSTFSTLLIPWLLEPYKASPETIANYPGWVIRVLEGLHTPHMAFGIPGLLMLLATVVFWMGRRKFVHIPPSGRKFFEEFHNIDAFKASGGFAGPGALRRFFAHFNKETLRTIGNLLIPVPFVAMFWALWQQNFSSWVEQATKMDLHFLGREWLPAQVQTVNPIFVLTMLPLFSYVVYPLVERVFKLNPLRKIGIGLIVTALSFVIIALIQVRIDAGARPNIVWQVVAFAVLSAGEVMVSPTHQEFSYTQAPKRLKAVVMCLYLVAVSLGNTFTALVNFAIERPDHTSRLAGASYFYFFAGLMFLVALGFIVVSRYYRGRTYIQDET